MEQIPQLQKQWAKTKGNGSSKAYAWLFNVNWFKN
jgi:hypothetical protein